MARTYTPYDETNYPGSTSARQIDNQHRRLKLEIREIVNQIIGVAEATALADPIVPVADHMAALRTDIDTGLAKTLVITVPWFGLITGSAGTLVQTPLAITVTGASGAAVVTTPIVIPVGGVITEIAANVLFNDADHSISAVLKHATGATATTIATVAVSGISASPATKTQVVADHVVLTDRRYYFETSIANNNLDTATALALYGLRVTYTSANPGIRL